MFAKALARAAARKRCRETGLARTLKCKPLLRLELVLASEKKNVCCCPSLWHSDGQEHICCGVSTTSHVTEADRKLPFSVTRASTSCSCFTSSPLLSSPRAAFPLEHQSSLFSPLFTPACNLGQF